MHQIASTSEQILGFTVPERDARGRILRLEALLDAILSSHAYPPPIAHALAEALVITALIGSLIKGDGSQVTLQARGAGGALRLLVCDYRDGELRGYVDHDPVRVPDLGTSPTLEALFGEGYLALTFDVALPTRAADGRPESRRYQGVVPLEGASLAEAVESYFWRSEQVPTLLRVAVAGSRGGYRAAGMLLQHLPEGEEGRERLHVQPDHPSWEHVAALGGTVRHDELLDPALPADDLVWRLFHEEREVRVFGLARLVQGCRCTEAHYRKILGTFPESERAAMRGDDGMIGVDCHFCSKQFRFAL
ncbi:Hsp33 family molecular chaperone HslO [Erythrobacteraceae bacterium CFH 75059]|nr:Hsp33 family molecular chaperone HslO [Erythrobacteraceae bacterium CFH 75059]